MGWDGVWWRLSLPRLMVVFARCGVGVGDSDAKNTGMNGACVVPVCALNRSLYPPWTTGTLNKIDSPLFTSLSVPRFHF